MRRLLGLYTLLALAACAARGVPDHLRLDPTTTAPERPIASPRDALHALLRGDPLARSQRRLHPDAVAPHDPTLAAWLERVDPLAPKDAASTLGREEDAHRGTALVALSRGRRLALAEVALARIEPDDPQTARELLALLTPLREPERGAMTVERSALDVFTGEGPARARALAAADTWVLGAWLDGPGIDLQPVAEALRTPMHDRLAITPLGTLILARADASEGDPTDGWAALERATTLALEQVAADRDREQAAWRERREQVALEVGGSDPVRALLEQAQPSLLAAAGDDRAAGGALVAIHAARIAGTCDRRTAGPRVLPPCRGLDRVDGLSAAARWDPDAAHLAALWQVIALKQALDYLDLSLTRPAFPEALVDVLDALIGTGITPPPIAVVERARPGPPLWLDLGRALGLETTEGDEVRDAMGAHLQTRIDQALARETDGSRVAILERIRRRAR